MEPNQQMMFFNKQDTPLELKSDNKMEHGTPSESPVYRNNVKSLKGSIGATYAFC